MGKTQLTDISAYERNVQDADQALVLAQGAVTTARRELDERRALDGLEPVDYDAAEDNDTAEDAKPNKESKK